MYWHTIMSNVHIQIERSVTTVACQLGIVGIKTCDLEIYLHLFDRVNPHTDVVFDSVSALYSTLPGAGH